MLSVLVCGALAVLLLIYICFAENPKPIFGKYNQPGPCFWIKYAVFRALLKIRKGRSYAQESHYLKEKEKTQEPGDNPMAFDAVFFISVGQDGTYVLVACDRKQHGVVNGFVYILVPGIGLLRTEPDVLWFGAEDGIFGARGVKIRPLEPMRRWKIEINDVLFLQADPSKHFSIKLDAIWSSEWEPVDFGKDMSPHAMAKTFATEPWSREYFEALKTAHQNHYEQAGKLQGRLQVDEKIMDLDLMSWRDRSFGACRDWSLLHRYALFIIFLEDGTIANVTVVNQPCTCTGLQVGYVYTPKGEIHPVEWTDFLLYQHGENGSFPDDLAFSFKAGETVYRLKMKVVDSGGIHIGWRWEALIFDRMVTFEVNGVKGRGISEVQYSNELGRDPAAAKNDPDWFHEVLKKTYKNRTCGICHTDLTNDPQHHHFSPLYNAVDQLYSVKF